MVDVPALRGKMVTCGYNQKKLSEALGISQRLLVERLKRKEFKSSEIEKISELLQITDDHEFRRIFFKRNAENAG